jgi:hypothetical protein
VNGSILLEGKRRDLGKERGEGRRRREKGEGRGEKGEGRREKGEEGH